MNISENKVCSMVRTYQNMIEAPTDVKTTSGSLLYLFSVDFIKILTLRYRTPPTGRPDKENEENHIHEIQINDLKEVVNTLIPDNFAKCVEKTYKYLTPSQYIP